MVNFSHSAALKCLGSCRCATVSISRSIIGLVYLKHLINFRGNNFWACTVRDRNYFSWAKDLYCSALLHWLEAGHWSVWAKRFTWVLCWNLHQIKGPFQLFVQPYLMFHVPLICLHRILFLVYPLDFLETILVCMHPCQNGITRILSQCRIKLIFCDLYFFSCNLKVHLLFFSSDPSFYWLIFIY